MSARFFLSAVFVTVALAAAQPIQSVRANEPQENALGASRMTKERSAKLDEHFLQLKFVEDENAAHWIEGRIWMLWSQSGRSDIDDLLTRAKINVGEDELQSALNKLDEIVKRAPDFAEGWNQRATVLFHMGEFDRSLADIEKTLALEPRHFGSLAGRGVIQMRRGLYKESLAAFERALQINPFLKERRRIIPFVRRKLGVQKI